jgi:two-component system, OmpR family, alkaline phosphatase synthesis response regulator PhoP
MPRVLIADDNSQNAELLEAHLDGTGWDTKIAVNGDETLALVKSWQPDVVLLDVMMPKLSGFDVCKAIRADEANVSMGILMVTALDQPSDVEKAINAGTDDFLTKPIHKSELLLRVRALLEARKQTNETDRSLMYFRQATVGA